MLVISIMLYFIGRGITYAACLSLCKGKWRKNKSKVYPKSLIERIFFLYLLKAKTEYPNIMKFAVVAINIELVNTVLCYIFCYFNLNQYVLFWGMMWLVHLVVLTFLFRRYVRK